MQPFLSCQAGVEASADGAPTGGQVQQRGDQDRGELPAPRDPGPRGAGLRGPGRALLLEAAGAVQGLHGEEITPVRPPTLLRLKAPWRLELRLRPVVVVKQHCLEKALQSFRRKIKS